MWQRPSLVLVLALVVGCGGEATGSEFADLPVMEVHADDFQLLTVEELAAASDLVVSGTVTGIALGALDPAPELEDFGGERLFLITLAIETVIKGAIDTDTVTLETSGVQVDESGEPEAVYIVNGIPAPSIGSNEVWFLVELAPGQWREVDSDDAQFARSGDKLTALASTAGPAARKIENLGFNNLVAGLN